jgi:tetratricopeptide (TPR) repeat protein
MAEPRRAESASDRETRVESLLVAGLDLYFAGRFDDAVHLWTRVLFLDRSHARARAYIDRARTAMAERQRRAEEWLQASEAMLAQGRTEDARDLLARAAAATGDDEPVSAVRVRLERMERAHAASRVARAEAPAAPETVPGWIWPRRSPAASATLLGLTILMGIALVAASTGSLAGPWLGIGESRQTIVTDITPARLPVLSAADVALVRARTLYTRGRLAEALLALDRVGPDSRERAVADQLRIEIQQLLLATSRVRSAQKPGEQP